MEREHGPGVGPHPRPWPEDPRLDPELLEHGDRRNVADRYRYWSVEAIVADLDTRRHPLHVAIENWGRDFNIGSVVRTANAFNVAAVHIVGRRRWNRRGAMVTDRYLHVLHHEDVNAFEAWARERGIALIGIDNVPGSQPLEGAALPRECALVFGEEGPGLTPEAQIRLPDDPAHHPARVHALDQRRRRRRRRDVGLGHPAHLSFHRGSAPNPGFKDNPPPLCVQRLRCARVGWLRRLGGGFSVKPGQGADPL